MLRGSSSIWPRSGSNRVDEGGKSRQPAGDFVVARASWGLWEADSFLKSVTHGLKTSRGDSGAFILRHETSTGPHSDINRVAEGGMSRRLRGVTLTWWGVGWWL